MFICRVKGDKAWFALNGVAVMFKGRVKTCPLCGAKYVTKTWKSGIEIIYGDQIRREFAQAGVGISPIAS